jgi:glutamate-1-semialdehyde aminotransferase
LWIDVREMQTVVVDDFVEQVYANYASKRPKSKKPYEEARSSMPGGDTRSVTFYRPFPAFVERGEEWGLYDVGGHLYIDIVNNERYRVIPDLTAPGKTIEGGYPAVGIVGREEFMDPFSPLNKEERN